MEEEEEEGAADEHVWTSLKNSAQIITSLAETISEADSANAETYRANASAYVKQFEALDAKFTAFFEGVKNKTIVIADSAGGAGQSGQNSFLLRSVKQITGMQATFKQ